jgi:FKBP-type peptidyl-prolyl cis-trans isomerase
MLILILIINIISIFVYILNCTMNNKIVVFCLGLIILSCSNEEKKEKKDVQWSKEKSSDFAKEMAIEEEIDIKLFLEQHKDWKLIKSGTGLQYYIYKNGLGDSAKVNQLAMIRYKIQLLDGTVCHETSKGEVERFVIDHSDVETGIQEGIKKMREGDNAKFIIPSHLAHGLVGDLDKIPPLNPIVVDVKLIELR